MYGLDNPSGISVMPTIAPAVSPSPLWFTEGGAGQAVSYPGQDWYNMFQAEHLNVLADAGIVPVKSDLTQLSKAIKKLISDGNAGFLKTSNNLSEIKTAGAAAMAAAVGNIGALPATGTAAAATKLATARKIGGVDFDGTKDITLPFINTTDANVQLAGNLGAQGNITAQGSLIAKTNIAADGRCDIVGDVRGGRIISKGAVYAGEERVEGSAALIVDGNIQGTLWGGNLYAYLAERELIGIPIPYPLPSVPVGYLKCNGAAFSTVTYPKLALKYPSGVLPDMRGNAIRGWDDGRGVDAGRALLSQQLDALQNITGNFYMGGSKQVAGVVTTGAFGPMEVNNALGQQATGAGNIGGITFDASRVARAAAETRMRNIAFNYIVRAI
ncbi:phage tail protein [Yersinia massiliensis]|uniref:phage tail protein n=1 Tax=Yersinia massiliensis TaxID=419257 RepID=UPI0028D00B79|nr:phage tail protein [Yersinia massiliensis]